MFSYDPLALDRQRIDEERIRHIAAHRAAQTATRRRRARRSRASVAGVLRLGGLVRVPALRLHPRAVEGVCADC